MTYIVIGIIFTLVVLVLSLLTISKGYGFKHSVDALSGSTGRESDKQGNQRE